MTAENPPSGLFPVCIDKCFCIHYVNDTESCYQIIT